MRHSQIWSARTFLTVSTLCVMLRLANPVGAGVTRDVPCDVPALISAIETADRSATPTTLSLAAGCTYTLTTVNNTAKGPNGLPVVTGTISILGHGAVIERSSDPATPPFRLVFVRPTGVLTLKGLTLRNGRLPGGTTGQPGGASVCVGGVGGNGGGILNRGSLMLKNTTVTSNRAGAGGAGANMFGRDDDNAGFCKGGHGGSGGGIFNDGSLGVSNSTISNNASGDGGAGGRGYGGGAGGAAGAGGGIVNHGTLHLVASTISSNHAGQGGFGSHDAGRGGIGGDGGAVANTGSMTVVNSTLHANAAGAAGFGDCDDGGVGGTGGSGGAIANTGTLMVRSSTITYNSVGTDPSSFDGCRGGAGVGGGVSDHGGVFTIANSILDGQRQGDDCAGAPPAIREYSLAGHSCGPDRAGGGFEVGEARLASLGDHGGATPTRVPLPGSFAIDRGDPAGCRDANGQLLASDQRGRPRSAHGRCDIGAVEFQPGEPAPDAFQCGAVLGPRGTYNLTHALECGGNPIDPSSPALTILTGTAVRLNGYAVTCTASTDGVWIDGDSAALINGHVNGCRVAVRMNGSHSIVTNVAAAGYTDAGFIIVDKALDDQISGSSATGPGYYGFGVFGAGSILTSNRVAGNRFGVYAWSCCEPLVLIGNDVTANGDGIDVEGPARLVSNHVHDNAGVGIDFEGCDGELLGNVVTGNGDSGVWIDACGALSLVSNIIKRNAGDGISMYIGNSDEARVTVANNHVSGNTGAGINVLAGTVADGGYVSITGNAVSGHATDLAIHTADCGGVVWQKNVFGTASNSCIR